jgi:hypothetical protein
MVGRYCCIYCCVGMYSLEECFDYRVSCVFLSFFLGDIY